jgi:hypothetical protein
LSGTISGNCGIANGIVLAVYVNVSDVSTIGNQVTADASGNYSLTGLADTTYYVVPFLPGNVFTPNVIRGLVISGGNTISGQNFTAAAAHQYALTPIYSDNFTPNANPLNPTNWTVGVGSLAGPMEALGGFAQATSANFSGALSKAVVPNDQYVQAVLKANTLDAEAFVTVRISNDGFQSIFFALTNNGVVTQAFLGVDGPAGETDYLVVDDANISPTDVWTLLVVGSEIAILRNGNHYYTLSDSTLTTGKIGIFSVPSAAAGDSQIGPVQIGAAAIFVPASETTTTIQARRGLRGNLPASAAPGELLFTTDTHELFFGMGASTPPVEVQVPSAGNATSIQNIPVSATPPGHDGEILIYNGAGNNYVAGDPIVSGPDAPGSAPTKPPVQIGLVDGSGNVQRVGPSNPVPVSAAALPLPTGAATSALQTTGNTSVASIDTKTPTVGQKAMAASSPVVVASDQSAVPVSAASLPLPAGAATSALQTTGNTSVASIDTKTPTVGQKAMAASRPVVVASDQSAITVSSQDRAALTYPVAVTDGQAVSAMADKAGRGVTVLNAPRDLVGTVALSSAAATATVLIAAGAAGVFNDIISLVITNETSTATVVSLSDSGAGGTIYKIALAANGGIVLNFTTPLPQGTAAAAWDVLNSAAVALDYIVIYAKNK